MNVTLQFQLLSYKTYATKHLNNSAAIAITITDTKVESFDENQFVRTVTN